jgi:hypothetical protein
MESYEDCLANAYLQLGKWDDAIDEYRRILLRIRIITLPTIIWDRHMSKRGTTITLARSIQTS